MTPRPRRGYSEGPRPRLADYHYVKDMPCNGAALRGAALASAVVAAALFLL